MYKTPLYPHRKRQLVVRSAMHDYCLTDVLVTEWRPGNDTWSPDRRKCYYRPSTASLARLERLLKSNRLKPTSFVFRLLGPDVCFEIHGPIESQAVAVAIQEAA